MKRKPGRWSAGRMSPVAACLIGAALVTGADAGELDARIREALRPLSKMSATCGVAVVDLDDGSVVFRRGADRPLIPASNQKILVMAAALEVLGPRFEFRTVLGRRGRDLVIVGDGDPGLGDADLSAVRGDAVTGSLERWASTVRGLGWSRIEGDLILDESIFDGQWTHPRWESDDLGKWYAAPVGALNVNDNCVEVTVWPTAEMGAAARCRVDPPCALIEIVNQARSARDGIPVVARLGDSFRYALSGTCGSRVTLQSVSVPDPGLFFAEVLRGVFERAGVVMNGGVRRERVRRSDGSLPSDLRILAVHRTPLRDVLRRVGKDSQNLFAECLAKRVGYEHMRRTSSGTATGSWVTGAAAMTAFMRGVGADPRGMVISDASGLSRDNRLTPDQIVGLLVYMHAHRDAALFADSLAVAGRDGSLRKRMRDLDGLVVGKTGTLRGVKALSGYVLSGGIRRFAFSMIVNGIKGWNGPYKRVQDDLCRALVRHVN